MQDAHRNHRFRVLDSTTFTVGYQRTSLVHAYAATVITVHEEPIGNKKEKLGGDMHGKKQARKG
jgi:hypothetical protein